MDKSRDGTSMISDRLYEAVNDRGPVCLGLDPSVELVPPFLVDKSGSLAAAYLSFNEAVIAATWDVVAAFKVQIAHYEALGVAGLTCYRDTLRYLKERRLIVIGDVKRGDIGATSAMYAHGHFQGDFEADFLTINPLLGSDSIAPFLDYVRLGGKGLFVLVRTSNPSASEIQDLGCVGRPLYLHLAELVRRWGKEFCGECGYSAVGAVVGASASVLEEVRKQFPELFLLVPGYGAQGSGARDVAPALVEGNGALIVAARSILGAYRGRAGGERAFAEHARAAALTMREGIQTWRA